MKTRRSSFIREVNARVDEKMGWNDATQGITTYLVNGNHVDLIKNYGLIPMSEIVTQSKPWYEHTGAKREVVCATPSFHLERKQFTPQRSVTCLESQSLKVSGNSFRAQGVTSQYTGSKSSSFSSYLPRFPKPKTSCNFLTVV
jgi:hypothetical protein